MDQTKKKSALQAKSTTGHVRKSTTVLTSKNQLKSNSNSNVNLRSKIAVEPRPKTVIVTVNGEDVTPVHFSHLRQKDVNASGADISVRETVSDLLNHLDMLGGTSFSEKSMQKSSAFGDSQALSQQESLGDEHSSDHRSDLEDGYGRDSAVFRRKASVNTLPGLGTNSKQKDLDPQKTIRIRLTETNTMFLLSIPSVCVSAENIDECTLVKAQNAKYKELKSIIPNNDNYVSRGMQTLSHPTKTKDVQATGQKSTHAEVMVNEWSIYDEYHKEDKQSQPEEKLKEIDVESRLQHFDSTEVKSVTQTSSAMSSTFSVVAQSVDINSDARSSVHLNTKTSANTTTSQLAQTETVQTILQSQSLLDNFSLVEKAIVGNSYSKKMIMYRNVPDDGAIEQKRIEQLSQTHEENEHELRQQRQQDDFTMNTLPTLQALWTFKCELTRGRQVTFMSLNKQNEDIVAIAYGESRLVPTALPGLILCWSAKNPEWPDRIYYSPSPVTSVDFSRLNPGLLAAGFMDGRIVIYDVRQNSSTPILDDSEGNGKHRDPVWELKWIEKERVVGDEQSKGETLVSVSTDGRVTQWMIRKGLEFQDLMILKRMTKQKKGNNQATISTSSFIARQTGGLCFDFNHKDSNIYLVGTEDGQIHKCSSSYNEQYLNTYSNHTGPVSKVKWSPFLPNVFLSCSSDWTVRLWNQDCEDEVFKFQSGKDTINDIAWSPQLATFFASVSASGRLEIWDLEFSVLDPAINHVVLDRQLTAVQFGQKSPTVLTGDDYGAVTVYKMCRHIGPDEDPTSNGILSPYVQESITEEQLKQWKQEQMQALTNVLNSKVHNTET